jgi:GNAT superfamily N-acetyltransferase
MEALHYMVNQKKQKNNFNKGVKNKYYELVKNDSLKPLFIKDYLRCSEHYFKFDKNGKLIGAILVVPRTIFSLPTLTWIVHKKYRKKGIASIMLSKVVKQHKILFVKITRGRGASYKLAKKFGFKTLFRFRGEPYMFRIALIKE